MLRVYRSESPLLGYINADFYRTPWRDGVATSDGVTVANEVNLLIANMDLSSKENYLEWVYVWKEVVAVLSELNHHMKRPKNFSHTYQSILTQTKAVVIRDMIADGKVVTCEDEAKIDRKARDRIETLSAWLSTALTALYTARATGKLATSAIVMMTRDIVTEPRRRLAA